MENTNNSPVVETFNNLVYGLGLLALFNIVCAVGGTVYRWFTRKL